MSFKPSRDLFESLESVAGLSAPWQLMILALKEHHFRLHAVRDEGRKHLVSLIDRAAVVFERMDK